MTPARDRGRGCALGLLGLLLILPFGLWYGFAIKTLWNWFAVPLGTPRISIWIASGLYVLVRLLTQDTDISSTIVGQRETTAVERISGSFALSILPAFSLALGALYHALA